MYEILMLPVAVVFNTIMSLGAGIMRDAVWNEPALYHRDPLTQNIQ